MALNWQNLQQTVYNVLKNQGFAITVRVDGSEGTWDPVGMKYTDSTGDVDYSTFGIKSSYKISEIDGTIVQQGDTMLLFPAHGLPTITTTNKILINGIVQNVINISPVDPGNITLIYEAQVRS